MQVQSRQRLPHLATVAIGSNLGDREAAVAGAVERLVGVKGNRLRALSSLYETEPFGKRDQAWFLNCVLQLDTDQGLKEFFGQLQRIEAEFGRQRGERWGPRTLDLDLLLFDDILHSDPELTIPHPGIPDRRFVLEPLCEIAPDLVHPSLHLRMRDLLAGLRDASQIVCLHRPPRG